MKAKEATLTASVVSKIAGRGAAVLALLGIVIALAISAFLSWGVQSSSDSLPSVGKPVAGKSVSGAPSRRA
jgi:hypothetical protein